MEKISGMRNTQKAHDFVREWSTWPIHTKNLLPDERRGGSSCSEEKERKVFNSRPALLTSIHVARHPPQAVTYSGKAVILILPISANYNIHAGSKAFSAGNGFFQVVGSFEVSVIVSPERERERELEKWQLLSSIIKALFDERVFLHASFSRISSEFVAMGVMLVFALDLFRMLFRPD
ncbi:hypothetical protein DKX38_029954 [Salix brachista]|uniref:Uncharacterized protein n=1 Tax=Salix brachista TaxID=2182728 RepID=A0A5N5J2L8_9ROSI|nr:hypothetical protein DKX38_029954 [Salix brachista]